MRRILLPILFIAGTALGGDPPVSPTPPANNAANPAAISTFWTRDTVSGNWGGWRSILADEGVAVTPVYEAEVFGAVSGGRTGAISDGLLNVAFDFDLQKLTHFWQDAAFHFNVEEIYGPGLTAKYTHDLSGTSSLAGYNTIRLQEIWLQQAFLDQRFSIRAGLLAVDSEFFAAPGANTFIDGTFTAFTLLALNFNDAPVYPLAAPAVRLDFAPVSFLDFKFGVYAPDENENGDKHGADLDLQHGSNGALFAFEAAWLANNSGSYKVGAFINRGDYADWASQAANALDPRQPVRHGTNWAVYGVADQVVCKQGARTVEAFAHAGFASPIYSFVTNYFDVGFDFTGFVPGRDQDTVALGVARSGIGQRFSESREKLGGPAYTQETAIELTYKAELNPWWSLQPDIQYLIDPGGVIHTNNALVLGLRSTLSF